MKKKRVKKETKKNAWKKLTPEELNVAKQLYAKDMDPSEIAALLGRDKSTLTRRLCLRKPLTKQGPRTSITEAQVDKVEKRLDEMIVKANGEKPVTIAQVMRSCRLKCSERALLDKLHARGVYLRVMREKPVLTEQDIQDRKAFGKKYKDKPTSFWTKHVHLHIDCKMFKVCLNQDARSHVRRARVKGAYRKRGHGLAKGYTKPPKKLKYNPGQPSAHVLAGVGQTKVLVWHYLEDNWSGSTAAAVYRGPIAQALKKAYPDRTTFNVLEDNDPSGFQSRKGLEAKADCKIKVLNIPKRSPCLNVCDYALWDEINRRMHQQEESWKKKKETRAQYLARLRRTALSLPANVVQNMIHGMKARCQRLHDAKGGNIEEGVKTKATKAMKKRKR